MASSSSSLLLLLLLLFGIIVMVASSSSSSASGHHHENIGIISYASGDDASPMHEDKNHKYHHNLHHAGVFTTSTNDATTTQQSHNTSTHNSSPSSTTPQQCSEILQQFFHECISPTPLHLISFYTLLASKFFLLMAPILQLFRLVRTPYHYQQRHETALNSKYLLLMLLGFLLEVVCYVFMKRFGILGVWSSSVLMLLFLVLIGTIMLRRLIRWHRIRRWRRRGFLVGVVPDDHAAASTTLSINSKSTPSTHLLSNHDTRSSFLSTSNAGFLENSSTDDGGSVRRKTYAGLTVDMLPSSPSISTGYAPHQATRTTKRSLTNWLPLNWLWRRKNHPSPGQIYSSNEVTDRDFYTLNDDEETDATFTVKTPQSTPGFYYQTPSRASPTITAGHSLGSLYSSKTLSPPSSQGILRYHYKKTTPRDRRSSEARTGRSRSRTNSSVYSSHHRKENSPLHAQRHRNSSSSRDILNTTHELPIEEILQSSYRSHADDQLSESSELQEYDTPPDEMDMDTSHRDDGQRPSPNVAKKLFKSPSQRGSATIPQRMSSSSMRSGESSGGKSTPHTSPSLPSPVRPTSLRKPVNRRLYATQQQDASPFIEEASYANENVREEAENHPDDSSVFASLLPLFLFAVVLVLGEQVRQIGATTTRGNDGSTFSAKASRYPLPWPPQSVEDIISYSVAFVSNLLFLAARFPQVYFMRKLKSSEGVSKMFILCFILSNLCYSVSVLLFVIDTMDILAQLPFMIGTVLALPFDALIFLLCIIYTKRDVGSFDIFSEDEEEDFADYMEGLSLDGDHNRL